jgi:hypothetical protein
MDGNATFAKTPKGVEEVEKRTYRLPPKTRQVLIFVDGKRNRATLGGMVNVPDVDAVLEQLLSEEFVSLVTGRVIAPVVAAAPVPVSKVARDELPVDQAERLKMARSFIMNTTETFLGMYGAGLIDRAQHAKTVEDFRAIVDEWYEAICSEAGNKRGTEMKERLVELL